MEVLPSTLNAGLTFERLLTLTAHKPADGWALSIVLRGPASLNLTATADGEAHRLAATALETAAWAPGLYHYSARVARGTEVHEIEFGRTEILADLSAVSTSRDARTHNEIVLDNINAVIEKRATQDQEKYRINNRELWRTPLADLLKLKNFYTDLVRQERARAAGRGWGRTIKARFQ